MIELDGKWCYTQTERTLAEYGMIELCAKADIYRKRMNSFLDKRVLELSQGDEGTKDRITLFDAEWTYAEQCFLELSRQATVFQHRLLEISAKLDVLAFERDQFYLQVDSEMRAGRLAREFPIRESSKLSDRAVLKAKGRCL